MRRFSQDLPSSPAVKLKPRRFSVEPPQTQLPQVAPAKTTVLTDMPYNFVKDVRNIALKVFEQRVLSHDQT